MNKKLYIAVDFDGTCVEHEFPYVGADAPRAAEVLKRIAYCGHKIILFTMRSNRGSNSPTNVDGILDVTGNFLDLAVDWFKKHEIPLYGINENPDQKSWTTSPKVFAHMYIDDMAIGVPLINTETTKGRPVVNWHEIEKILDRNGVFDSECVINYRLND